MAPQTEFECDSCDYAVTGYTKKDLDSDDWRFYTVKGTRVFTLCPECVAKYAKVWDAKPKATA